MKFYVSSAFLDTREIIEVAKAADDLGFYIPAMRNPYSAAKAIGTAAYLAEGRVELGIGVGWCAEEFALMEQPFTKRGKRTDEMLDLMRTLWSPDWTEFNGDFYQTPRLEMQPTPPRIPIYVGGLSDIALCRAARYDGWIGDLITTDRAIAAADRLRELRFEKGLTMDDFTILTPLTDAFTVADYQRAEDVGISGILTMPWMFYTGPNATLAEKVDGMKKFHKDLDLDD
jgi:alkanesulfonate monooxygenase SsuD/methylene tetrahydromethanopterin reductase-like flavin-dependent oxidoreductase (luciferase family)